MVSNLVTLSRVVLLAPLAWLALRGDGSGRWGAVAVFLLAGLTDVVDGRIARARGEVSVGGALLDLIADRLLTMTTLVVLVVAGALHGWGVAAGWALIARDLIVASLGEAFAGRLGIKVTMVERVKITCQFGGLALLLAPAGASAAGVPLGDAGEAALVVAALLALVTLTDYGRRAVKALRSSA
jgi:CDP-diacylglycerol--glycerol-3-phosphate 3-phosphatidyltransferase